MKRPNRPVAALFACVTSLVLASAIAVAQPASPGAASSPMGMSGEQGSMMGGGMMGGMAAPA
jgi:hypothetical protein